MTQGLLKGGTDNPKNESPSLPLINSRHLDQVIIDESDDDDKEADKMNDMLNNLPQQLD